MLTAGIDLSAQPSKTGIVVLDWSGSVPRVLQARKEVLDADVVTVCREVTSSGGRVGIDCPLGWPRPFVAFVAAHASHQTLPHNGEGTHSLRLRTTDDAVYKRLRLTPLSVSTNLLGVTAMRSARLLEALRKEGMPVDRSGVGTVCEVYPAASRIAWGLQPKLRDLDEILEQLPLEAPDGELAQLQNEHVFDALIAALTARAVALGDTDKPPPLAEELAAEEGWIHLPSREHHLAALTG